MARAVIVVDMQNGFMSPGGTLYCGDEAREIIAPLRARVEREKSAGAALFFTRDTHAPDDAEFEMFPPHCVEGSGEEEIIPELADLAAGARIVRKRRYSAFFETDLAAQLQELQPEEVVVMGDCTDICVLHTVSGLRNRDYKVEVPADCVASFDPEQHEWALGHMEKILGARITNRG
ncbi:MAG: cysteine hydrolase [Gemmatimonadetes bacterium]|nr:cysteine hydrolase [Gemmatimonadota bacterium]